MPRTKYTKPPGPLPPIEHIQRSKFRFRNDQRRKLTNFLPSKLSSLPVPSEYVDEALNAPHAPTRTLKTIADAVIHQTEVTINLHLTGRPLIAEGRINPANVRAAIRRLRKALEQFTRGWVDDETAEIVPENLDAALAAREQELASLRLPPARRRALALLCQTIRIYVANVVSAKGATISAQNVLKYIDFALTCAGIDHPAFAKHRHRLAALVFPEG